MDIGDYLEYFRKEERFPLVIVLRLAKIGFALFSPGQSAGALIEKSSDRSLTRGAE